jgi:hypothetical protein
LTFYESIKVAMRKTLSLIFVCLLLAPATVWMLGVDLGLHVERIGLQPPRFYRQALFENEYYQSFDQYFNDSFSLRSPLILAKRWLDYRIFHMTDTAGVHVGINGWLYSRRSIEDYRKEACNDRTDIEWLVLELHALEKIIQASGRRFLFFVAPNKSTIYPEFVGHVPPGDSCRHSRLDLLNEAVATHPLKSFIRLGELLKEEKKGYTLLYEKDGTYWNEAGALIAAEAIQQHIFESTWEDRRLDYKSISTVDRGDLNNLLMGLYSPSEDEPVGRFSFSGEPNLPRGILYSDDFTQMLLPYALQMFSRLEVIRAGRFPSWLYGENLRAFDVILLAKSESELGAIHIGIDKIFSTFENESRIPVRYPLDLKTVEPLSQIALGVSAEGLEIKSLEAQSALGIRSIPGSDDNIFRVLKLAMDSPHPDSMIVRYMTGLPYITSKSLKPGLNNVYLPLPFQNSITLQIHPGSWPGLFLLRSAEILEFPGRPRGDDLYQDKTVASVTDLKTEESAVFPEVELEPLFEKPDPDTGISVDSEDALVKNHNAGQDVPAETEDPASKLPSTEAADLKEGLAGMSAELTPTLPQSQTNPDISDTEPEVPISVAESGVIAPGDFEVPNSGNSSEQTTAPEDALALTPGDAGEAPPGPDTGIQDSVAATSDARNEKVNTTENRPERVEMPVAKAPKIVVSDFEDGRIFQRRGRSADIVVSGKYSGNLKAIEARVIRNGAAEEVVPWTTIDAAPRNGIFVGVLPQVPQGGWYNIQVRSTIDHAVSSKGKHKWGVGTIVAALGQSNMKEWFYTGTALTPNSLLRKFSHNGWAKMDKRGDAAIAFGNRIIERLGIPVGLLDYSKNGSGLRKEADWGAGYWEDTTSGSIYDHFLGGVSKAGGAVEFVIWIQGEADAARGSVTQHEYRTSLESFITNQVRADVDNGSDREYLPFLIVMMVKRPGGKDAPHQAIRNAQKHVTEKVADCYLAATTLDLKNQGRQHLTLEAYITMGRRVAQTVLFILGAETYHRGPWISDIKRLDNRTVDVKIRHRGGTGFTPAAGITGWEVLANGTLQPIVAVYQHDPQTIRMILKNPLPQKAKIRYLYGAMPDANNPVIDNSAMALPLEEYQSEIN